MVNLAFIDGLKNTSQSSSTSLYSADNLADLKIFGFSRTK